MIFESSSRVALVTGAGDGIGRSVAEELAAVHGARVYVLDKDAEAAASVALGINEAGGRAKACVVDLSDEANLRHALLQQSAEFGPPDILVNNSGIVALVPAAEYPLDQWHATIAVNLTAPMLLMQHVLHHRTYVRCRWRLHRCRCASQRSVQHVACSCSRTGLTEALRLQS